MHILTFLGIVDRALQSSPPSPAPSFISLVIPQLSSASISFVASTSMAITIARTGLRLTVPYRRIIFGLSIADMIQSLGFLVGPLSVPRSIPGSWGLGNQATCKASGFLVSIGLCAVPMYTCFVCLYYLCKLKYRMSDEAFAHKTEKKIHATIILTVMVLAIMALIMDTFHVVPSRTYCNLSPTPVGCRAFASDVPCDATITPRVDIFRIIYFSLQLVSLLGMIGIMSMIYWHVIKRNRLLRPRQTEGNAQEEVLHLSSLYKNEVMLQATCYVGAFILTYILHCAIYLHVRAKGRVPPEIFVIINQILLPLGGFFNILVYSRPQAASLRRSLPEYSRLHCLWLVLKAGGEIPQQPSQSTNDSGDREQDQRPRYSFSSHDPFGESDISLSSSYSTGLPRRERAVDSIFEENWASVEGGLSTDLARTVTTAVSTDSDCLLSQDA